ncbi:MAG: hypothetical protein Q8908_14300 [Bacteroidota bacterium]|nr:hypothetical protein [Bacteroidota bacterium]
MKKLILLLMLSTCGVMFETASAQVSFRINIGMQPLWGPVGYDHVEYYYLPDIEAYYYVPTHRFFYMDRGNWVNRAYLPERYRDFDLYHSRRIVINEPRPYLRHNEYRERYTRPDREYDRQSIRDSRDSRYFRRNHNWHDR